MKSIFLVYTTDCHHSQASRDLIGCATTHENALKIIQSECENLGETLSEDSLYNLKHIKQTQGHEGEYEFLIDELQTDVLLFQNASGA